MPYDPAQHHRRSIRLQSYDYAQAGAYFVTIVTERRLCLFGEVVEGQMLLNPAGQMIDRWWLELANKFSAVEIDHYVVMPNHFHGLLVIVDAAGHAPLSAVQRWFKTMSTNDYIRGVNNLGWSRFQGKLWQRNYYEHVIRNEADRDDTRLYILNNPAQWALDQENPTRPGN